VGDARAAGGLVLVAVLVARLFKRQLELVRELDELEAVRDALRPAVVVPRPELELAAHYVPAQQGVGGDFFLTAQGPRGRTPPAAPPVRPSRR
jgi:serine phosphatase RsbU (regulator of sigma subunit)